MLNRMQKYNKAFVPLVMGMIYLINEAYGIEIPLSEMQVNTILFTLTGLLTFLIPNKEA